MAFCNLDKVIYDGVGKYDIPEIEPYNGEINIDHWLGFNYVKKDYYCRKSVGVHFCLDDYQFETIWNHPTKYIDNFRKCGILCSPDFSLYSDFPLAIQIYNHYRKHWLAKFYQDRGSIVIPTIAWSDESSYDWCFDGEPTHSVVAISSTGVLKSDECFDLFVKGTKEMVKRLQPTKIICFTVTDNVDRIRIADNMEFVNVSTFRHKPQEEVEGVRND